MSLIIDMENVFKDKYCKKCAVNKYGCTIEITKCSIIAKDPTYKGFQELLKANDEK